MASNIYLESHPQITALKQIYKTHTSISNLKEKHDFDDDGFVTLKNHNRVSCINKMHIQNYQDVDKLYMIVCSSNLSKLEIGNRINNLVNYNSSDDFEIMFVLTRSSLQLYDRINHLGDNEEMCQFAELPNYYDSLIPRFINNGKKLIMYAKRSHQTVVPKLHIKYLLPESKEEACKFIGTGHEYLIKTHITHTHNIGSGTTTIKIPYLKKPILTIYILARKNNEITDVKLDYNVWSDQYDKYVNKIDEITKTTDDPEFKKLKLDNYDIYLRNFRCDTFDSVTNHQPLGNQMIRKNSKFVIQSNCNMEIDILYSTYNVVRYTCFGEFGNTNKHCFGLGYKFNTNLDDEEEVNPAFTLNIQDQEQTPSFISQLENPPPEPEIQEEIIVEPPPGLQPVNLDDILEEAINEIDEDVEMSELEKWTPAQKARFLDLNFRSIYKGIEEHCKKYAIKCKLDEGEKCNIDHSEIKKGEYYYKCTQCKLLVKKDNLDTWFFSESFKSLTCMICRNSLNEYPQLYVNLEDNLDNNVEVDSLDTNNQNDTAETLIL